MMKRKTKIVALLCSLTAGILGSCVLAGCGSVNTAVTQPAWHLLSAEETDGGIRVEIGGENLLLKKGVRILADSQESEDFSARFAADGISDEDSLRWSSENDWEDNEHWLQVKFPEKTQVGYVKLFWERTNACAYAIEYSEDGKNWSTAAAFDSVPDSKEQNICLETPVTARFLRLHVTDVTKEEADLSLYYQNVSVLEMEVYGAVCDSFVVEVPRVESGKERILSLPQVPDGYGIALGGIDYENLLTADQKIADTLSDVTAEVGLVLQKEDESWELPGMEVEIPGCVADDQEKWPDVMEWKAGDGVWESPEEVSVASDNGKELADAVVLFGEELRETALYKTVETLNTAQKADIVLELADTEENSLGKEGYEICVEKEQITIRANTVQGVRWGCVTLYDWMEQAAGTNVDDSRIVLPVGIARDYPKYPVRGFGIDVGRRAISLDLLYRIVEEMSAQKMNTLQIHLNDNQIIAQSQYDGTVEGARNLYAGFRLESDIRNKDGVGITSQDLFYTKEEFQELIDTAAVYGVEIVPEIDTPAHSLALTKVFPELGFSGDPESVDQLDLSKKEARQLAKDIWKEYLTDSSTFENCTALHLGMDEYYGKDTAYVEYLEELSAYVKELAPKKQLRIWGSLSKVEADHSNVSREIQMHVWETEWAKPDDMYAEGFPIINSLSSSLYIIPGAGYDRMDVQFLEEEWQPNLFITEKRIWELPAWSERVLGACYMMWNDWSWANGDEISEEDLFDRFAEPLPVLSRKLWGER